MEKEFDVICIGRSCVDLYSEEFGSPLERAMFFSKSVGGSPMNIAIGASRLGLKVGAITGVGREDNGRYLRWALNSEGVDTSHIKEDPGRLTAMVLLSIRGENDFPLIQYRENCADMGLVPEDISPEYLARARAVLVTGTHLSREGVRGATMKVLETARKHGIKCIFDIDFRPNLWGLQGHDAGSSRWAEASERITREYQKVLPYFDLIVGTEEEYFIAGGRTEAMTALRAVRELTDAVLVFKLGDKGCAVLEGQIPEKFGAGDVYPGFPVKVYNSIGAGDGFMAGFLRGWLRNEPLENCCRYANAAGAFAVSRLGCSSAYPSWEEMQFFIAHGSREEWLRKDRDLEQLHWSTNRRRKWDNLAIAAFDHRQCLEDLARKHGRDGAAISQFKGLVFEAVRRAAEKIRAHSHQPGIIVDDAYGLDVLFKSNATDFWVARAIEKSGSNPLEFQGGEDLDAVLRAWPENHVVKCLLRPGEKDSAEVIAANRKQIVRLAAAARSTGHELLLEIVPAATEKARADIILSWVDWCHEEGIYPDYWKVEAMDQDHWAVLKEKVYAGDPHCRGILVLGMNKTEKELAEDFGRIGRSALGFAVGRSIFMPSATAWFAGEITDDEAIDAIGGGYQRIFDGWRSAGGNDK